jgi:transcriptional regulator with XRE-family HTH domain/Zn-dependent peptidase ImmA (M78 family)
MTMGKRIAARRKTKTLTQATLAERVGVTTAFISQIESDNRKPSYGLLLKIAHAVDATIDSLLSESPGDVEDPADRLLLSMIRNLNSDGKRKVLDHISLISGCKVYQDFPVFSSPIEYAKYLVEHFKIKQIPVDIRDLCEKLGVQIVMAQIGDCDGILLKDPDAPTILLNSERRYQQREKFTTAILLGHLVVPWHLKSRFYRSKDKKSLDHEDPLEMEAREFAGELMLPSLLVKKDLKAIVPSIEAFEKLASQKYQCSLTAVAHKFTEFYGTRAVYLTSEKKKITRKYSNGFSYNLVDAVKDGSLAHTFVTDPPLQKETRTGIVDGSVWFEDASPSVKVKEESMLDPEFGVTVTLLQIHNNN